MSQADENEDASLENVGELSSTQSVPPELHAAQIEEHAHMYAEPDVITSFLNTKTEYIDRLKLKIPTKFCNINF